MAENGDLSPIAEGFRVTGLQGQVISPAIPQPGAVYVYSGPYPDGFWSPVVIGEQPGIPFVVFIGPAAPPVSQVVPGVLWWDNVGGNLYIWYDDGNSAQWVVTNSIPAQTPTAGPYVASFNSRTGAVVLTLADIVNAGGGTVTNVIAGNGLTGGEITSFGTIALATPVSVANGGTANSTFANNGVLFANPTGTQLLAAAWMLVSPTDSGLVLRNPTGQVPSLGYGAYLSFQPAAPNPPALGQEIGGAIRWEAPPGNLGGSARINVTAPVAWGPGSQPGLLNFWTTPVGSTAVARNASLDGGGNLAVAGSLVVGGLVPLVGADTGQVYCNGGDAFFGGLNGYLSGNIYRSNTDWVYQTSDAGSVFWAHSNGSFSWYAAAPGTAGAVTPPLTQTMGLDGIGNLAIISSLLVNNSIVPTGLQPSHVINTNSFIGIAGLGGVHLFDNCYWNGANFIYITNTVAGRLALTGGTMVVMSAPTGAAGQPVTGFANTMQLLNNGNMTIWGALTQGGSDLRLKSNIAPAKEALHAVRALEMIAFDRAGEHFDVGFSAQDVQHKIPGAVHPMEPAPDDLAEAPTQEPMLGFDLTPLVSYALKSIQELAAENDRMRARLTRLEALMRQ